jgi:signal transduction histidine kinase
MTRAGATQRLFIPLFAAFLVCLLWAAVLTQDHRTGSRAQAAFRLELVNTARLLEAQTRSTIRGLDQVVTHIKAGFEDDPGGFSLETQIARSPILAGQSVQVGIIDAAGFLVQSTSAPPPGTRLNLADREHFRVHAETDSDALFISKPVLGRASGKWSIQLTRRLNTRTGEFAGVVVVSLGVDYLTATYRQVDLGENAAIVVVGQDGVLRARTSGNDHTPGQSIADAPYFALLWQAPEGFVAGPVAGDGIPHFGAYRRMADYPLALIVSRPVSDQSERHADDHQLFWLAGIAGTVLIVSGSALLLLLALRQQRTEKKLIAARNDLERRNHDMEQFTEVLAHHLQEPVRLQVAFATRLQRLLADVVTDETRPALEHVINGATRLRSLLRDVQLYLAVGLLPPARQPCGAGAAVEAALSRLHPLISHSRAVVRYDPLPDVMLDPNRLADTFSALIENAIIHHRPDMAPEISITSRPAGAMQVFSVSDTGIGIPEEFRERVFRVFERLHPESGRPGTGIGLPLVKKIVEACGGRVWIEATATGGTRVCFSLPARSE